MRVKRKSDIMYESKKGKSDIVYESKQESRILYMIINGKVGLCMRVLEKSHVGDESKQKSRILCMRVNRRVGHWV